MKPNAASLSPRRRDASLLTSRIWLSTPSLGSLKDPRAPKAGRPPLDTFCLDAFAASRGRRGDRGNKASFKARTRRYDPNLALFFQFKSQCTDGAPPNPAPSDEPVIAASNRGNKLRQGAKFVHEGTLIHVSGPEVYKEVRSADGYCA